MNAKDGSGKGLVGSEGHGRNLLSECLRHSEQNGDRNINLSNAPGELSARQQQNQIQKQKSTIATNNNNKENMFLDPEEKKGNSC